MLRFRGTETLPLVLDKHLVSRVSEKTLELYRQEGRLFVHWMASVGLEPEGADEWDNALVEYKNCASISRARFSTLIACVEFFFVRWKGQLAFAKAVASGWEQAHHTRHTITMGRASAALVAVWVAAEGDFRLAAGLTLQVRRGLRPSEMLRLTWDDVLLPEDTGDVWVKNMIVIRLGARIGTKLKREQFTILREARDSDACTLLRRIRAATASGARLFPSSLARYARRLKQVQERHGALCGWTPHSPSGVRDGLRGLR